MVIQLASKEGLQIKRLENETVDVELNGGDKDFQIDIPRKEFDERIGYGCRIFVPGTEIGGVLGELSTSTSADVYSWSGYTWRGLMAKKVIEPSTGEDYYIANGELNDVIRNLIEPKFDGGYVVPAVDTGVTISGYQFKRYCTLLDGLVDMLKSVGYRLEIAYNEGQPNESGYVEVQAVPIVNYADEIELSQDSKLNFKMQDKRNGINHLIVLGKGELKDRTVINLYVQADGSIGDIPYYTGIDEIARTYENTFIEESELRKDGIKKLQELMNKKIFEMDVEKLGISVAIGDIVGGRDYVSGMYIARPVANIIIKIENGKISKEYKLEGNDETTNGNEGNAASYKCSI